ncbi:hypothetical protein CQA49_09350 [Helicobacter sp. MIT 00-7814]|uniref:hypothetical protein n=1 Tax=unclassified Helicobacter TaxID=2593540 RepID=UPI000E1F70E7|nr:MULTISPECIES: hypothetical protein [unclassified Helicobacter]RDU51628.1 hypothetical protein CQA49_09350 [Helicobacter sp. MIT 00-7814]RDU51678.1 hypothetical protein CQA37_09460 [Helicobacter sp. MIT 99-10781]
MQQKVNHISYLSVVILDLSLLADKANADICVLPEGAEVLDISLEVLTPAPATSVATLSFDGKEFLSGVDIATQTTHRSASVTTLKKTGILKGNFTGDSGEVKVRVHYFLPSKILAEYV